MNLHKRIKGDFLIETVDKFTLIPAGSFIVGVKYTIITVGTTDFTLIGSVDNIVGETFTATGPGTGDGTADETGGTITIKSSGGIVVDGDLTITGTSTSVESTNTSIVDNIIVLNSGETGSGISDASGVSGIEIDRGTAPDVIIRYNDSSNLWEATDDGTTFYPLSSVLAGGLTEVHDDATPELGGDLDVNGFSITSGGTNPPFGPAGDNIVLDPNGSGSIVLERNLSIKEQLTNETAQAGYNKLYAKVPGDGGTGLYVANTQTQDELVSNYKAKVYGLLF